MSKISVEQLDQIEAQLRTLIKDQIEDASDPIGYIEPNEDETDVWDDIAAIDSKLVATAIRPSLTKLLGAKFPLKLIKNGGYESIEAAVDHLIQCIRAWCGESSKKPASEGSELSETA